MSYADFSVACDISENVLWRLLNEDSFCPPIVVLVKIARYKDVPVTTLINEQTIVIDS